MPVHYALGKGTPLSAQCSPLRTISTHPPTQFEVKVETIIDAAVALSTTGLHAESQKTIRVRPDIVVRETRSGKATLVVDAKHYAGTLPVGQVEKLKGDMRVVGAPRGVLYVAEGTSVSERTVDVARRAGIEIIWDGREGGEALAMAVWRAGGLDAVEERVEGKGAMVRYAVKTDAGDAYKAQRSSGRTNPGPLKKDGTPDMRYAANKAAYGGSKPCGTAVALRLPGDGSPNIRFAAATKTESGHPVPPPRSPNASKHTIAADDKAGEPHHTSKKAASGGPLKKMLGLLKKSWRRARKKDGAPYNANR